MFTVHVVESGIRERWEEMWEENRGGRWKEGRKGEVAGGKRGGKVRWEEGRKGEVERGEER